MRVLRGGLARRVAAGGAAALALGAAAGAAVAQGQAKPAPSRLLAQATEFRFSLSRSTLKAGTTIVQLAARGEDPHDLKLVRVDTRGWALKTSPRIVRGVPETEPGTVSQWRGRLAAGRWKIYCSLEGHEAAGMRAFIRVR